MDDPEPRSIFRRGLRRRELIGLDVLVALGYLAITLPAVMRVSPGWVGLLVAVGAGAPSGVRWVWPVPVFLVVFAASVGGLIAGVLSDPLLAAGFAIYPVALTRRRRRWEPTLVIGAVSALGVLAGVASGSADGGWAGPARLITGCAVLGCAWTLGRAVRERRAAAAAAAERLVERSATEERLRIARELHDVVSHTLSLIGVKAAVANHVADSRPDEVRDALRVIEGTSQQALTEMRHMLGLLRSDGAEPATVAGPVPGLDGLEPLAERAAQAGVPVELTVREAGGLPEDVARTVFRIVQEAVTNVVRHAAPARCTVLVDGRGGAVRVEVTDDGPGRRVLDGGAGTGGHGLVGMRERVAMHGGTMSAGPRPGGGFAVRVTLPVGAVRGER